MLLEIIRFAVYTICVAISISLFMFLGEAIAKGEEWGETDGFFIISPLLIIILLGAFIENFKQIMAYPMIWGMLLISIFLVESFFTPPELQAEPDMVYLAYISPFPYLLAVFGLIYLFLITPLAIGFILGFIKRKVYT
jgi:hypothetical protein